MDCNYLEGAGRASGYGQGSVVDDVRLLVSSVEYFTVTSNACDKGLSGWQPPALCEKPFRSPCHRPIEQSEINLPNDPWGLRPYQTPNW
jgi:hypothetical protein